MKIKIVFSLILFSVFATAQSYDFNMKCVENSVRLKPKIGNENSWRSYIYFNTSHNKYYLTESTNGSRILQDNELKEVFQLSLIKSTNPYYALSNHRKLDFGYSEREIEKVTSEKVGENEYLVKVFPNQKAKRSNLEVKFKLKKSESPLVQIRFMDLSPSIHQKIYESLLESIKNENFWIEKAEVDYRNGYKFLFDFSQCEENKLNLRFES